MNEEKNTSNGLKLPQMKSIREIAAMGVLREGTLRELVRENKVPHVKVGRVGKVYINCDKLLEMLNGATV